MGIAHGGGAADTWTRPAPRPPMEPCHRSTERRGPLTPSPGRGLRSMAAVWLHVHGVAAGSAAAIIGQRALLADPARDCGRTRGRALGETRSPDRMGV